MRTSNIVPTSRHHARVVSRLLAAAGAVVLAVSAASVASAAPAATVASDQLTPAQVVSLVQNAKTPADHTRLETHFAALAVKYDTDAREHRELAVAYRKSPTASDTKRPGAPDTASHCERFARLAADAATEARAMAAAHKAMAAGR